MGGIIADKIPQMVWEDFRYSIFQGMLLQNSTDQDYS